MSITFSAILCKNLFNIAVIISAAFPVTAAAIMPMKSVREWYHVKMAYMEGNGTPSMDYSMAVPIKLLSEGQIAHLRALAHASFLRPERQKLAAAYGLKPVPESLSDIEWRGLLQLDVRQYQALAGR
jgi:hypothetical protein